MIKGDSITFEVNKELLEWRISKNDTVEAEKVIKHLLKIYSLDDFDNYSKVFYYSADKFHFLGKPILRDKLLQELIDSTSIKRLDTSNFKTTYYRVSKEFFKYEDTLQGVELLKKLIEKIPSSKEAYNQLGNYYYKKNNDKTISYFKEYIKHDSLNATVYRKIGLSYLDKNFKKSAKKYLAISANKGDKEACFSLRELTAKTKYYTRSICWDGTTSSSTGRGTCSHHGGVRRVEYVPYKVYTIDCK